MNKVLFYTIASLAFAFIVSHIIANVMSELTAAEVLLTTVCVLISLWGAIIVVKLDSLKSGDEIEDDSVSDVPQKKCPQCEKEHDFDYPKCPHCKHEYN